MKVLLSLLVYIIFVIILGCLIYFWPNVYEFFGKRYESATSNIMQNNLQTIRGNRQYIRLLELELDRTKDIQHKEALKTQIELLKAEYRY